MNIKEHIDAQHYPCDSKGRALVPLGGIGGEKVLVTILATDVGENWPIVGQVLGHVYRWDVHGRARSNEPGQGSNLLPPKPRKEKILRYGVIHADGRFWTTYDLRHEAQREADKVNGGVVELTGDYEVPW